MEAILFIGVQASGKSTFYQERFFSTHLRINLDMLHTRHRERQFLDTCLRTSLPFVIDNTNPTKAERQVYIEAAKASRYRVVGYYFQSSLDDCKLRNDTRPSEHRVLLAGLLGTYARLELPSHDEGFDALYYVKTYDGSFTVEEWRHEV